MGDIFKGPAFGEPPFLAGHEPKTLSEQPTANEAKTPLVVRAGVTRPGLYNSDMDLDVDPSPVHTDTDLQVLADHLVDDLDVSENNFSAAFTQTAKGRGYTNEQINAFLEARKKEK